MDSLLRFKQGSIVTVKNKEMCAILDIGKSCSGEFIVDNMKCIRIDKLFLVLGGSVKPEAWVMKKIFDEAMEFLRMEGKKEPRYHMVELYVC